MPPPVPSLGRASRYALGHAALRRSATPAHLGGSDLYDLVDLREGGLVGLARALALGILGAAQEKAAAAAADEHRAAALLAGLLDRDRISGRPPAAAGGRVCSASWSLSSSGIGAVPRHLG